MKPVNIGICGLGTVASGTLTVLQRNREEINARAGRDIRVTHVASRSGDKGLDLTGVTLVDDVFAVARAPEVDIVVELIGGYDVAKALILEAINNGKHIITANKALIAEHGNEIFAAAKKNNVAVYYEAAVAGGIPIIKLLREGLVANRIEWLAGIINGTGNYILTQMRDHGESFDNALLAAQQLGYAEADPSFDVDGIDACHKLIIMASLAFGIPLQFDKAFTEGIRDIAREDVKYADELGYCIKHLGIARRAKDGSGIELRVHPTLIPKDRLIASVDGVMNAVVVKSDAVGTTLHYGPGAGAEPTASSVIADIVDVARSIDLDNSVRVPVLAYHPGHIDALPVLPISEVKTAYYMRLSVRDKPGVLSLVASNLSANGISIESMIQKPPKEGHDHATLIITTSVVKEQTLQKAVNEIEQIDSVNGKIVRIRLESLK